MRLKDNPPVLTVADLTRSWENKSIHPNPEYQRGSQWNERQQQLLIDSVLRGYPLPRFYFHVKQDQDPLGNPSTVLEVIDGQQRINALCQFHRDSWPMFDPKDSKVRLPTSIRQLPCPWSGLTFSQLAPALQERFLGTAVSSVFIDHTDSPDEVRDLFIRLQAGTPLTRQQVRDAWPGNIGPFVESLAGKLAKRPRFDLFAAVGKWGAKHDEEDESVDQYMEDRQTCAQLLHLFLERRTSPEVPAVGVTALDDLYHGHTDFNPQSPEAAEFQQLLKYCDAVLGGRSYTTAGTKEKMRKHRVFSLFMLLHDLSRAPGTRVDRELNVITERFWSSTAFATEPVGGKAVSPGAITTYYRWLINEKFGDVTFGGLDAKRLFDDDDKRVIRERAKGKCAVCHDDVLPDAEEFDHVKPWILGGRTITDNGRLVHQWCHERGRHIGQLV